MLGAAHTLILMKLARLAGIDSLTTPIGLAVVFGNLLPDNLPVVGVAPESSHDPSNAAELSLRLPPLGAGIMVHIYADNLTHCGSVANNGNYAESTALKLGLKLMEETGNIYSELVKKYSPRSFAYSLHMIIEIAADVLAARDEVVEIIEKAWRAVDDRQDDAFRIICGIYHIEFEKLLEGWKRFPPEKRPAPDAIYSRRARAELFMRKFSPKNYDAASHDADHKEIMKAIEAGENMMRDGFDELIEDFAKRIYEADSALMEKLRNLQ